MLDKYEYEDLSDELYDVQSQIRKLRNDDVFDGDQLYQRLLEKESEILKKLSEDD